jgi:hypothetical protein
VLAPVPSIRAANAITVKPGFFASVRRVKRQSRSRFSSQGSP